MNTVHTGCVLTLIRETREDEVTTDDGEVWRIEAYTSTNKRNLEGIAFDNAGYSQKFTVALSDAYDSYFSSATATLLSIIAS